MGDYGVSFLQADENDKVLVSAWAGCYNLDIMFPLANHTQYCNCTGLSRCPRAKYYTSTEVHIGCSHIQPTMRILLVLVALAKSLQDPISWRKGNGIRA